MPAKKKASESKKSEGKKTAKAKAATNGKKKAETKAKKSKKAQVEYKEYHPSAKRKDFKPGDIVYFPKVRDWLNKGRFVEAYGKVINIETFDDGTPYLKVSFSEAKELNKVELGSEIRKFILEQKG